MRTGARVATHAGFDARISLFGGIPRPRGPRESARAPARVCVYKGGDRTKGRRGLCLAHREIAGKRRSARYKVCLSRTGGLVLFALESDAPKLPFSLSSVLYNICESD